MNSVRSGEKKQRSYVSGWSAGNRILNWSSCGDGRMLTRRSTRSRSDSIETTHINLLRSDDVTAYDPIRDRDRPVPGHAFAVPDDKLPLRIEYDGSEAVLIASGSTRRRLSSKMTGVPSLLWPQMSTGPAGVSYSRSCGRNSGSICVGWLKIRSRRSSSDPARSSVASSIIRINIATWTVAHRIVIISFGVVRIAVSSSGLVSVMWTVAPGGYQFCGVRCSSVWTSTVPSGLISTNRSPYASDELARPSYSTAH